MHSFPEVIQGNHYNWHRELCLTLSWSAINKWSLLVNGEPWSQTWQPLWSFYITMCSRGLEAQKTSTKGLQILFYWFNYYRVQSEVAETTLLWPTKNGIERDHIWQLLMHQMQLTDPVNRLIGTYASRLNIVQSDQIWWTESNKRLMQVALSSLSHNNHIKECRIYRTGRALRKWKAETSVYDSNNPSSAVLSRATHYYKTDGQSTRFVGHKLTKLIDYHIMTLMVTVASWLLVTRWAPVAVLMKTNIG